MQKFSLNNFAKSKSIMFLTIVIILLFLIFQCLYIFWDNGFTNTDVHLFRSLLYYDEIVKGADNNLSGIPFPPITYLVTIPFYLVLGLTLESARLSLMVFSLIFLLSMYGIGKELGDEFSGFITMAIAASSPAVLDLSTSYFLEFPQTAMTALALYMMIKSCGFRNKKYSILFGITLALSFLTKWSTAFFLVFPVLWLSFSIVKEAGANLKKVLILLGFIVTTALMSAFYFIIVTPGSQGVEKYWYLFYITAIVLPSIGWHILDGRMSSPSQTRGFEKEGDNNETTSLKGFASNQTEKTVQKPDRITNFGLFFSSFVILTASWFFWAAQTVLIKHEIETIINQRVFQYNFNILYNYLIYGMNLFPLFQVFLAIGLLFLIVKFKEYYSQSILYYLIPLNIIAIILIMTRVGFLEYRYYLSIVIFLSAAAGFWTCRIKKYRALILTVVFFAAFFSIAEFKWLEMGQNENPHNKIYYGAESLADFKAHQRKLPLLRITGRRIPITANINMEPFAQWLTENETNSWEDSFLFVYPLHNPHHLFLIELIPLYTYREGTGVRTHWRYWIDYYIGKKYRKESLSVLLEPSCVSDKLLSRLKKSKTIDDSAALEVYYRLSYETISLLEQHKEGDDPSEKLKTTAAEDLNKLLLITVSLDQLLNIDLQKHQELDKLKESDFSDKFITLINRGILEAVFENELDTGFNAEAILNDLRNVNSFLIIRKHKQNPAQVIEEIHKIFPHAQLERRDFAVADDLVFTALKMKKKQ